VISDRNYNKGEQAPSRCFWEGLLKAWCALGNFPIQGVIEGMGFVAGSGVPTSKGRNDRVNEI